MAKNKTTETAASVGDFIAAVADDLKRVDSQKLVSIFENVTGQPAKMWGAAIVGFGSYHYKYDSGHEGDAPLVAFSPRANAISLYLSSQFPTRGGLLQKLGKHKSAKACIYVKKLNDVDEGVLKEMIRDAYLYSEKFHQ
ncbi:DUF1801 domain-containing protein [Mucilaginibacter ginkgonis]|uniref:DUF1801 domain-containing protein n=1 Tax=Mucilaginibacter ginkgonis TaxID=2682091 RepID=A0A6I4HYE9_9SPHI|nr:DUF1801 domain-containing protein [Mucilaginibacter ginkgonis]QQL51290.1 DUF1801 domain-containing protein [Mucilaginibacter ginkgonis]